MLWARKYSPLSEQENYSCRLLPTCLHWLWVWLAGRHPQGHWELTTKTVAP